MATIKQQGGGKYSVKIGNQKFNGLSQAEANKRAGSNYQVAPDSQTDSVNQKARNASMGINPGDSNVMRDAAINPSATVNTSQPSPGKVPVGPQAIKNPPATISNVADATAAGAFDTANGAGSYAQSLAQRQKAGLATVNASGQTASNSQGVAQGMINQSVPGQNYVSPPDIQTEVDKALNDYTKAVAEYLHPDTQRKSLVEEYQALSESLGIPGIQAELLDINRIMDGSEDDIRSEVTAASGFATESQVQAMTIGRNKSLLKKAQYLSDQLTASKDQLNTLSQLNSQDRQLADQKAQTGIALLGNMVTIKQTMQKAAQDNYRWYAEKAGMDSLYASTGGDAYNIKMVEKTLGLPPGGLQTAAVAAQQAKKMAEEDRQLDRSVKKASIANSYDAIAQRHADNTIMVDTSGKIIVKQKEAVALNKELTSTDAYKAIQKGKDSLAFLKSFEDTFSKTGATSAVFSPRQNADLNSKYTAAILNLKEFFNLGVVNGPDEKYLQGILPDPTGRSAALTVSSFGIYKPSAATQSGITNMKKMIEVSLDDRFKTLTTQYGDYSSQSITSLNDLGRQYVEQKLVLHPEGFDITVNGQTGHVNPDGSVTTK